MRDQHRLEPPKFNTFTYMYGLRSFRYYGSKLWNVLPFSVKNTKEFHVFKKNIIEGCHSTQCRSLEVFWHSNWFNLAFLPDTSALYYFATLHILHINSCILAVDCLCYLLIVPDFKSHLISSHLILSSPLLSSPSHPISFVCLFVCCPDICPDDLTMETGAKQTILCRNISGNA